MSDQIVTPKPRRPSPLRGRPSNNPRGRPRSGLALAERVRKRVDLDELVDIALSIARGEPITIDFIKGDDGKMKSIAVPAIVPSVRDRLTALTWIRDTGFCKPAQLVVQSGLPIETGPSVDYDALPEAQLRSLLDAYDDALDAGRKTQRVIDVESKDVEQ